MNLAARRAVGETNEPRRIGRPLTDCQDPAELPTLKAPLIKHLCRDIKSGNGCQRLRREFFGVQRGRWGVHEVASATDFLRHDFGLPNCLTHVPVPMCSGEDGDSFGAANRSWRTRAAEALEPVGAEHRALGGRRNLGRGITRHRNADPFDAVEAHGSGSGRTTQEFRGDFIGSGTNGNAYDQRRLNASNAGEFDGLAGLRLHCEGAQRIQNSPTLGGAEPRTCRDVDLCVTLSACQADHKGI